MIVRMNSVCTEYTEVIRSVILPIIEDKNTQPVRNVDIVRTHTIPEFVEILSTFITLGGVTLRMKSVFP